MKSPVFSIIIATYKRPYLLERALRSVVNQGFRDFECVVVDDAGDPATIQIIEHFKDERIVLVQHADHKGAAAAYNSGIKASCGKLISILDDDDEFFPSFLEKMYLFFQDAPSDIGFAWTGIRRVIDTPDGEILLYEKIWPHKFPHEEAAYIAATTIGNGFGLTMKRECLNVVGFYDETFQVCEDTEHLFRLARTFPFASISETLVKIHRHNGNQLTQHNMDELRFELYKMILKKNYDLIVHYPELNYVHFRRLAEMCYSLKMKKRGSLILLRLWRKMPWRVSIFIDLCCYTLYGVDSITCWNNGIIKKFLIKCQNK